MAKENQVPQSNEPSTQAVENAPQFIDASNLLQLAIDAVSQNPKEAIPLTLKFYDRKVDGQSCIWPSFGCYRDFRVNINRKQMEKLFDFIVTGKAEQIFPLPDDEMANATEEDLATVPNIREEMLTKVINTGAYGRIKVLPFKGNDNHIEVETKMFGARLLFWIAKDSEVAQLMRKKHMIL